MAARILYCHCAYARVVPPATKTAVLKGLADAGVEFDAVPDLCEMSARRDPRLAELTAGGDLKIAACYPRAVKWLLASAGASEEAQQSRVLNMRTDEPAAVLSSLLSDDEHDDGKDVTH